MRTAIVIPAYNEGPRIAEVIRAAQPHGDWVIAVDDGSRDDTWDALAAFGASIVALRHPVNLGKGGALRTGCEAARRLGADVIVTIDGDGQHPPALVPLITAPIRHGECAAVFTKRTPSGDRMPLVRMVGNQVLNLCTRWAFHMNLSDVWCGFRAFTVDAYERAQWLAADYSGEIEMVLKMGRANIAYREVAISTIYHDGAKGVDILHGTKLLARIILWRFGLL